MNNLDIAMHVFAIMMGCGGFAGLLMWNAERATRRAARKAEERGM